MIAKVSAEELVDLGAGALDADIDLGTFSPARDPTEADRGGAPWCVRVVQRIEGILGAVKG